MKKFQRIAAGIMTAAMTLSLAAASVPAYAYDVTITDTEHVDSAAHTYSAYQIFKGTVTVPGTGQEAILTEVTWGDSIADGDAFLTGLKEIEGFTAITDLNSLLKILDEQTNDNDLMQRFADYAAEHVGSAVGTSSNGEFTLDDGGYYLITEPDDENPLKDLDAAYTRHLLRVVDDVEINVKKDIPHLDKVIDEDPDDDVAVSEEKPGVKANQVSIGDVVPYVLTSNVPDMTGYDKYFFIFNDTMCEGLTFNDDIEVTIGGTRLNSAEDFTVVAEENGFKLVLNDFIQYKSKKGADIVVTYTATLDEDAKLTEEGNLNTADLTFSNNPNYEYQGEDEPTPDDKDVMGKTPPSTTKTFTTGLKLKKVNEDEETLDGAVFKITGEGVKAVIVNDKIYKKNLNAETKYYLLKDGTFTDTEPNGNEELYDSADAYELVNVVTQETAVPADSINTTGVSDENGFIKFVGLGAGTYTITELKAPEGYNMLSPASFTVEIEADVDSAAQTCAWTVTKGEDTLSADTDHLYTFDVVNNHGITLPGTGGTGTAIFYTTGGVLLSAAAVLFVTKKRMKDENEK
ncbi:MAG TPA: hypothetical protein DCG49_01515 [Ruminococcus sp.]|nr:hypothetical protein [Ruminococcus sp.]